MRLHHGDESVTLWHGDCLDVLRQLPDCSVDSVVTDPPYGLGFMGKEWDSGKSFVERKAAKGNTFDHIGGNHNPSNSADSARTRRSEARKFGEWCEQWAAECLRVLKPGGHILAFGGSRTWHRLASAIEDAGFEIRDSLCWLYGSGFPKSLDVSKAIDKAAGAEREVVGLRDTATGSDKSANTFMASPRLMDVTAPATPDAERWQGWGTALKPAFEPVVVGRKPLAGTVAQNVLTWGTGALNIDGCRIEHDGSGVWGNHGQNPANHITQPGSDGTTMGKGWTRPGSKRNPAGRWPANVILDESQADALDQQSGTLTSGANPTRRGADGDRTAFGAFGGQADANPQRGVDKGGASRFFYVAREDQPCSDDSSAYPRGTDTTGTTTPEPSVDGASSVAEPVEKLTSTRFRYVAKAPKSERPRTDDGTAHPTVKPLALMRWLVRLVTPPGGTVLEPFAGSGTTVEACILEGFHCIAIEREADYLPLIEARIARATQKPKPEPDLFSFDDEEASA